MLLHLHLSNIYGMSMLLQHVSIRVLQKEKKKTDKIVR